MQRMWIFQNLICDPVIDLDGISYILTVCFEPYVECLPSCCEFYLPAHLAIICADICFPFVAAAFNKALTHLSSFASIKNLLRFLHIFIRFCHIDPFATAANWKVWKCSLELLLSDQFSDIVPDCFCIS